MSDRDELFVEFVRSRQPALRRTAFLLCGDWHRAEDLVQTALLKLYRAWKRVQPDGSADAYARKILVRTAIDERRPRKGNERPVAEFPDQASASVVAPETTVDLRRVLAGLPARQRAAVVLRYWEDLSVADTAAVLGCGEGTVKSQCAKALAALRTALDQHIAYSAPHRSEWS